MRRRYRSEEEILARKLLAFLGASFVLIVFAGVVFYIASTPPTFETPPLSDSSAEKTAEPMLEAFKDRIAQVQLGGWSLAERKAEARRLLEAAPTPKLKKEVELLIRDLEQEERFEKLAAFEAARRRAAEAAGENRFEEAEKILSDFGKENPEFASDIRQLKTRLKRKLEAAYLENERKAEEAIARGDVKTVRKLVDETLAFVRDESLKKRIAAWEGRAEERRRKLSAPEVAAKPPTEPTKSAPLPPESSAAETPPAEAPPSESSPVSGRTETETPAAPAESRPFADFLKVRRSGAEKVYEDKNGRAYSLDLGAAQIFVDETVPPQELPETLKRGTGLWILGRSRVRRGVLKPFGRTVARTIDEVGFAFLPGNFFPDPAWKDPSSPGRKWLFGKVELGFPVVRVTLKKGGTFLVLAPELRLLKRSETADPPELAPGTKLWVEGSVSGSEINAERVLILAPELAEDPTYLKLCR